VKESELLVESEGGMVRGAQQISLCGTRACGPPELRY
jgi:hypothetical protein